MIEKHFQHLLSELENMLAQSGRNRDGFDAREWLTVWLDTPVPAFANNPPKYYMKDAEGRALILKVIRAMQSGAYI